MFLLIWTSQRRRTQGFDLGEVKVMWTREMFSTWLYKNSSYKRSVRLLIALSILEVVLPDWQVRGPLNNDLNWRFFFIFFKLFCSVFSYEFKCENRIRGKRILLEIKFILFYFNLGIWAFFWTYLVQKWTFRGVNLMSRNGNNTLKKIHFFIFSQQIISDVSRGSHSMIRCRSNAQLSL